MSLISEGIMSWQQYSAHREAVKEAEGVYFGLLDENLEPICSLPYTDDYSSPTSDWTPVNFRGTFLIPPGGAEYSAAVEKLVTSSLSGKVSGTPSTKNELLYITVEPRDGGRGVFRIEFVTTTGGKHPLLMEVHGLSSAGFLLGELPYVSQQSWQRIIEYQSNENPLLWRSSLEVDIGVEGIPVYNSYSLGVEYPKTQDTLVGAIQRSGQFLGLLQGLQPGEEPVTAVQRSGGLTLEVDATFSPLADVLAEPAQNAGSRIEVGLYLPGDAEKINGSPDNHSLPTFVVMVDEPYGGNHNV